MILGFHLNIQCRPPTSIVVRSSMIVPPSSLVMQSQCSRRRLRLRPRRPKVFCEKVLHAHYISNGLCLLLLKIQVIDNDV